MIIPIHDRTPHITSILPSTTVHTRLLLVEGEVRDVDNGEIQLTPHRRHIATQKVSVRNSIFKTLIPLVPGDNEIELLYYCHESRRPYSSKFYCTYVPLLQNPPLKLVIIIGSDSPCTYDDTPDAVHSNNLDTAIKKLRMAGYIWAAYTAQEMAAAGYDQRTFRLDDTWAPESISNQTSAYMQTAQVHVLRSRYTTEEIRDPDKAQQNHEAGSAGGLYDIALQALAENPYTNGAKEHVSAMFLDAHYDPPSGLITGHAALGGGTAQHSLAIFGSHTIFSWPTCLEEMEGALTNTRPVDTNHCGIDGEGRLYYSACTVGIGAMMHETGHLFGCPHQEYGVMLRDYPRLHRSLTALDPDDSNAVVGPGRCHWHPLDLLRFLSHPSFAVPSDAILNDRNQSLVARVSSSMELSISSPSGTARILAVEIYKSGKEFPIDWINYSSTCPPSISLSSLALHLRDSDSKIIVLGTCETLTIDSVNAIITPKVINGRKVWSSMTFGYQPGTPQQIYAPNKIRKLDVFFGICFDGVTIHQVGKPDHEGLHFGNKGGECTTFEIHDDEELVGIHLRSGAWIDGVKFITSKRQSDYFGGSGGGPHQVQCLAHQRICGFYGEVGDWVNKMGILYTEL